MNDNVFKIGDKVKLKSGGPDMSITEIDYETNIAECAWFNQTVLEAEDFPIAALCKITIDE